MLISALLFATFAASDSSTAKDGVKYYLYSTTCSGAPDYMSIYRNQKECSNYVCAAGQGYGLITTLCNFDYTIQKAVSDAFGSTGFFVSEYYSDDKCSVLVGASAFKENTCVFGTKISFGTNSVTYNSYYNSDCSGTANSTTLPSNGFSSSTCTKFDSESAGFGRTYYKTIGSLSSARPSTGFSVSALWFLLFLIIG